MALASTLLIFHLLLFNCHQSPICHGSGPGPLQAGNGGVSTSGNTTNGKNGANANGQGIGNTTGLAIPGED